MINDFITKIEDQYKILCTNFDGSTNEKKQTATHQLNEALYRLEYRYNELLEVEQKMFWYDDKAKGAESHVFLQLRFVDKVEAFTQQVYVVISSFIMFLNHVSSEELRKKLPIRSVDKFLFFIEKEYPSLKEEILQLKRIQKFRVEAVDHIQQHTLHTWMTMSYPSNQGAECVVIYYIKNGNEVYVPKYTDPYSSDFRPPVNYKSFYVSPPYKEVYLALQSFIKTIVSHLALKIS